MNFIISIFLVVGGVYLACYSHNMSTWIDKAHFILAILSCFVGVMLAIIQGVKNHFK